MYKERRIAVKFYAVAEWFRYFFSPFQYVILTAIDIAQSARQDESIGTVSLKKLWLNKNRNFKFD
jgi:hypothetical protein